MECFIKHNDNKIMKKFICFVLVSFSIFQIYTQDSSSAGVLFQFKHQKDDASSYVSTVEEDVYYNGYLNHHSQIVNRISAIVHDVDEEGTGTITANYMTTEDSLTTSNNLLNWGTESTADFKRKTNGEVLISDELFMPTVRNVPVFPDYEVQPGDSWTAEGKEVHNMKNYFNMEKPLIIPFTAKYKYIGDKKINGNIFNIVTVEYEFYYKNKVSEIRKGSLLSATAGFSKQTLYWDSEKGLLDHYDEQFKIQVSDIYDNIVTYTGTSKAEITEAKSVNNTKNVELLQDSVNRLNLKDVNVKKGDKGLTISIENIQFEPDSAVLLDSEKEKLNKISSLLKEYSNDILITGHCADRGTESARQTLSEKRAESVAEYLESIGVRDSYHIYSQGKGSKEPIATNSTEEGRKKNRRVEITILN